MIRITDHWNEYLSAEEQREASLDILGIPLDVTFEDQSRTMFTYEIVAADGTIEKSGEQGVEHADATEAEMIQAVETLVAWSAEQERLEACDI